MKNICFLALTLASCALVVLDFPLLGLVLLFATFLLILVSSYFEDKNTLSNPSANFEYYRLPDDPLKNGFRVRKNTYVKPVDDTTDEKST